MGRKTWDSLPIKPLPQRINVVLSKKSQCISSHPNVILANDFNLILEKITNFYPYKDVFVIGGEQIYNIAITSPSCKSLIITHIYKDFNCTEFFPIIDDEIWLKNQILMETNDFTIIEYIKKKLNCEVNIGNYGYNELIFTY